jgi:hypothetical protein
MWKSRASVLGAISKRGGNRLKRIFPKVWNEAALENWATPVAGLNVRPRHISEQEYYSLKVENLRTYPVYYPGREPDGYWEMLQHTGPKPLIEPEKLKSEPDWSQAGRRVFEEADLIHERTFDPKLIAAARSGETFERARTEPYPDGTLDGVRWVPTGQGVALSVQTAGAAISSPLPTARRSPALLLSLKGPARVGSNTQTP